MEHIQQHQKEQRDADAGQGVYLCEVVFTDLGQRQEGQNEGLRRIWGIWRTPHNLRQGAHIQQGGSWGQGDCKALNKQFPEHPLLTSCTLCFYIFKHKVLHRGAVFMLQSAFMNSFPDISATCTLHVLVPAVRTMDWTHLVQGPHGLTGLPLPNKVM